MSSMDSVAVSGKILATKCIVEAMGVPSTHG